MTAKRRAPVPQRRTASATDSLPWSDLHGAGDDARLKLLAHGLRLGVHTREGRAIHRAVVHAFLARARLLNHQARSLTGTLAVQAREGAARALRLAVAADRLARAQRRMQAQREVETLREARKARPKRATPRRASKRKTSRKR